MGFIFGLFVGLATFVLGIVLIEGGNAGLGLLVIFGGIAASVSIILIGEGIALAKSVWDWVALVRSKPEGVRVVSVHPPKGFLIRREAIVTLDVEEGGVHREMEQGIPIPRLQAFLWRVAGKVPTPIGRLTDKRDLNAKVWGRRARPPEVR
jgi:hypothetical protein